LFPDLARAYSAGDWPTRRWATPPAGRPISRRPVGSTPRCRAREAHCAESTHRAGPDRTAPPESDRSEMVFGTRRLEKQGSLCSPTPCCGLARPSITGLAGRPLRSYTSVYISRPSGARPRSQRAPPRRDPDAAEFCALCALIPKQRGCQKGSPPANRRILGIVGTVCDAHGLPKGQPGPKHGWPPGAYHRPCARARRALRRTNRPTRPRHGFPVCPSRRGGRGSGAHLRNRVYENRPAHPVARALRFLLDLRTGVGDDPLLAVGAVDPRFFA
jgi:hypothetical protein